MSCLDSGAHHSDKEPGVRGTQVWVSAGMLFEGVPSPPLGLGHPQTHFVAPEEITASGFQAENKLDYGEDIYSEGKKNASPFSSINSK